MTEKFDQEEPELYEVSQLFEIQKVMNVSEIASFLKFSSKKVYQLVASGEIPHKKIGRHIRFHLPEIEEWLKGG